MKHKHTNILLANIDKDIVFKTLKTATDKNMHEIQIGKAKT